MGESQRVEQAWATPDRADIPAITRAHVDAMEASDDDAVWTMAGMHHVLVYTVGRKTGKPHTVALPFWRDGDGHRVVVASFAGAPADPAWYLNLRAASEVRCRAQHNAYWSVPEFPAGQERDALWQGLVADRAWYADYQALTDRVLPLVRLPETRPA